MEIKPVSAAPRAVLGDSPLWCKVTNSLIYVDILGKTVHNFNPESELVQSMTFDQFVGFAIPTSECSVDSLMLYVGLEDKIVEVNMSDRCIVREVLVVPEKYKAKGMRFNDAKCSPEGDLYAGYISRQWREGKEGYLFRVSPKKARETDLPASKPTAFLKDVLPREGIAMPNGSAWKGENTMYIVDSAAGEVSQLDFAEVGGAKRVVGRQCVYKLPDTYVSSGYVLDGMTIDSRDHLWVALSGAGCILRINPKIGLETFSLHLDTRKPTSCTFGGPNLTELYITTRNEQATENEPRASLLVAKIDRICGVAPASHFNLTRVSELQEDPEESNCNFIFCAGLF